MRHIFPLHGKSLLFGLILLYVLGALLSRKPVMPAETVLDVPVQHTGALALEIEVTTKSGASLISLTTKAKEVTLISVPDEWKRTQVRNTTLTNVVAKDHSLGFIQWQIPAGATVMFQTLQTPDHFRIINPSSLPMAVHYRRIDLSTGKVIDRSDLVSTYPLVL